jgi:predicted Zn-dependent protease
LRALAHPDRLRVIDGMYPAGEPAAGQPLKIVE